MKTYTYFLRAFLLSLLLVLAYCQPAAAAVTCTVYSGPDINFGDIDLNAGVATSTDTLGWGCQNPGNSQSVQVLMCFGINDSPSTPGYDPRYMPLLYSTQTGYKLAYTLYQDAAATTVLGSFDSGGAARPLARVLTVDPYYGGGNISVYGQINPSGQRGLPAGSYGDTLSTKMTYMVYDPSVGADCSNPQMLAGSTGTSRIDAKVTAQCRIDSASDMSFGTVYGLLNQNVDSTSTITVTCNGVDYWVGLGNGLHASGTTRRMQGENGAYIQYELYSDPQRTVRWGNSQNDAKAGTGNGRQQPLTVYGRVAPQALTGKGLFSDTVVVTVNY